MGKKLLLAALTAMLGLTLAGTASAAAQPGYVALGDSYASGVGTRAYIDDACKRSSYAYAELLAGRLGLALNFQACSGAKTSDVLSKQVGALSASTNFVTVSVGGNDIGFSSVIEKCALPFYDCTGDINKAVGLISSTLTGALDNVYTQIHNRAPNAKVVVVGYPRLFNGVACNALARISPTEEGQINAAADKLDTAIGGRASAHGFTFLDPRSAFTGHAVCDKVEWLNGLSNPVSESYHPNRDGHVGFANLLQPLL
ncbi:SGNH/GDSL hydrolase family protein [Kutzneria chonburiensis]|jgi:lysophospholipase L1-like esterase|uniref:SGNH/GDSL hydrolase family protein n=1 Tax=Kutzneria chonburiensis TaxID=1483604 RepID=A0ABV6MX63_9PSEU|nr:SGNH/GDSL hydrolase family protein [Kutzneria chonburiensis]